MSTATIERREYTGFLGRYRSDYVAREIVSGNRESKREHRECVRQYLLGKHQAKELNLFSFPSVGWVFEHELSVATPLRCTFCAVEREYPIFKASRLYMPGRARRADWQMDLANDGYLEVSSTDSAIIAHASCATLLQLKRNDFPNKQRRGDFVHRFKGWTCCWLDFTSMICSEVERIMPRISAFCGADSYDVPIAVTVMKGREKTDVNNKLFVLATDRVGYLTAMLNCGKFRGFELDNIYEHTSSETPMLTIFGRMVCRSRSEVPHAHRH